MIKLSKKKLLIKYDKSKPSIKSIMSISSQKAKKELGWKPKTNIDKGIKKTFNWWNKNIRI